MAGANSTSEPLLSNVENDEGLESNVRGEEFSGDRVNGVENHDDLGTSDSSRSKWLVPELKKQFSLAVPMVGVNLLDFSCQLVSVMFVGHLGQLELASASVATSFASVTGFCLLVGLASALETLCGQAYGAEQFSSLGVYLQRGIVVLNVASIPIAFLWINTGSILRLLRQDSEIADYAGQYARWMLPALFGYATLQPLTKFLQTQSAVLPMAVCSSLTLCFHIPVCWLLTFKTNAGFRGVAFASGVSLWVNVTLLVLYIRFAPRCRKTWAGFTSEALKDMKVFFSLALPSAVMVCLEFWAYEVMILLSGLLPNPRLQMSALSISLNFTSFVFYIHFSISCAASTRVSNELGAGKASAAKRAAGVAVSLGLADVLIMLTTVLSLRHVWAYAFTNDPEVINYVATLVPFLAALTTFDGLQNVLSGITRGCGAQELGAFSNLGAYYGVGLPIAITSAFYFHLNNKGLFLGIISALVVQTIALGTITLFTNWQRLAQKAMDRVGAGTLPIAQSNAQIDLF